MRTIHLFFIGVLLTGCYSAKKAENDLIKAQVKQPAVVANFARRFYPCVNLRDTIVHSDTAYRFVEVDCDTAVIIDTIEVEKPKTTVKKLVVKKYVRVPAVTIYRDRTIKDTAEIALAEYRLQACEDEKTKWVNKADRKSEWIKWLFIAFIASVLLNVLLITIKRKP